MAIETDNSADLSQDFALLDDGGETTTEITSPEVEQPKTEEKRAPKKAKVDPSDDDVDKVLAELDELEVPAKRTKEEEKEEPQEILPHLRPTIKQIHEKFPTLFKQFPSLRDSFFREKQFSEVFHTPAEAQLADETSRAYKTLQDDIVTGTGEKLIPALKESDSLGKFSSNFLQNLYKADKDLHWKTILPVLEDSVRHAFREGKRLGDDNLKNAALVLSNFMFADMEVAEGKKTFVEKEEPKDTTVSNERKQWEAEKFANFNVGVNKDCYDVLVQGIEKSLTDPQLTKFMKSSITSEVIRKVTGIVRADKTHMKYMDRLWAEAKSNGYKESDRARIYNATLARAKSLVPSIRRQLLAEAIDSSPQEVQRRVDKTQQTQQRREPGTSGKPTSEVQRPPSARRIDWKRTSDMDLLNDRVTLKQRT